MFCCAVHRSGQRKLLLACFLFSPSADDHDLRFLSLHCPTPAVGYGGYFRAQLLLADLQDDVMLDQMYDFAATFLFGRSGLLYGRLRTDRADT